MKITIKYSYDANAAYPYTATTAYCGKYLVGVSRKGFEDAEQKLLEIIEKAANIQVPEPNEIEI